jgi:serine O-acetyltransferase
VKPSKVGDGTSILHGVTLGGTGMDVGDRHPKVGENVTISANVSILGNINIGDDVKIGAGSLVLENLPAGCTAVGVPAKIIK